MSLLVYSASAGSGKTYTLALKYISLALKSDKPNAFTSILAVTFTNKASGEMKDRILGQLYNLAHGGLDKEFLNDIMRETQLSAAEVCQRAQNVLYAIMHDYDHFKVETIDSFFQSLLTNMAHELKLSRSFKVDLDDELVVSQAIDRMLLTLNQRGNKELINLVMDFMDRHIDDDKGWNIDRDLKAFAKNNLFRDPYTQNEETIGAVTSNQKLLREIHKSLRNYIADIDNEIDQIIQGIDEVAHNWNGEKSSAFTTATNTSKIKSAGINYDALPATFAKVASNAAAIFKKAYKPTDDDISGANDLSAYIRQYYGLCEKNQMAYNTCKLILQNLDTLALLGAINREVTNITSENGTFLLARTPELFSRMVQGSDASFVFEKAGTSFRHIMIDEFQDTSHMQWRNFKTLLFENQAQGDESMLVGDVKQSIYRWRDGDWSILFNIKNEMPQAHVEPKVDNFRSLPMIVRFNNAFFTKAALLADDKEWTPPTNWQQTTERMMPIIVGEEAQSDATLIERIYQDVEQNPRSNKGTGYVRVETFEYGTTIEERLQNLYDTIAYMHKERGVPYNEMLILVRKNSEAESIVSYTAEIDGELPITSEQAYSYSSSGMVMTLIYALKYIADTQDTLSLRSCDESYCNLFSSLEDEDMKKYFISCKEAFISMLQDADTMKSWTHTPLYELLLQFTELLQFQAIEKLCLCKQSAYMFDFLDAVLRFQDDFIADIPTFLSHWDDTLYKKDIATSATDAIQVMTIHKSKGLEAHTVFMPFADFSAEQDREGDIIWCSPNIDKTSELSVLFDKFPMVPVSISASTSVKNSAFVSDYEQEHLQMRIDALNELYVAFTRARNNLFVWSTKPFRLYKKNVFYWVDAFINNRQPSDNYGKSKSDIPFTPTAVEYGMLEDYVVKAQEKSINPFEKVDEENVAVPFQHGGLSAVSFLQSGKATDFIADTQNQMQGDNEAHEQLLKQREYINQGLLFHALFSRINTTDDVDAALGSLLREGVISTRQQALTMRRFVLKALNLPQVQSWFDGTYQLFNECSILYRNDNGMAVTQRPDRVMVDDKEVIVVDYKFGVEKRNYHYQVLGYMDHLAQLLGKPVKGYLWYVFEQRIEEVNK